MTEASNGVSGHALRLLGGVALLDEAGHPVAGPAAQRMRLALLAVLARAGDAGVTRDRLLGLLWPEATETSARASLASAIYALRRVLGDSTIIAAGDGLRLDAQRLPSDVSRFDAALAADNLAEAAATYAGPFLDGFYVRSDAFERWSTGERAAIHGAWITALQQLAARADDATQVAVWTRRLFDAEPTSSRLAQAHIRALVNVGDAPAARRCYEAHASAVRTELGIEPDPSIGVAAAGIAVSAPLTPAKFTTIESQAASPVATSRRGRMALLVALVLLLAVSFRNAATPVQDDDTSVMTVLVAPFAHDALGRALADASARRLVTLPDVRVLDPAAIQSNEQVLRAAQRLGVRWVVTGTWSKGADSLVAEASITDVRSGRIVVGIAPASAAAGDSSALIDAVSQRIAAAVAMTRGAPDDVRMATFTLPTRTDALEWFRMGLESAGRGDPILAARHLQRATAADPAFVPAAINLAAELLNAGDIIGARRVAARLGQSAHRLSPVERHLLDWLNNYLDGDLDAAARAAFAAHVSAPDSPELRVVAGQAALWTGKVDVAVQLLGSIDTLGTSPASDVGYWNDLTSALHLAREHERERETAHAAEQRFPELLAPALFTMRAHIARGHVDSVLLKLSELEDRRGEPGWSPAQIALDVAELLAAHGHQSAARRAAAIGLAQVDTARVTRAHLLHLSGQSTAALDSLHAILVADADAMRARGLSGVIATLLQRHTSARDAERTLERSPDAALATYWRARMAAARQDPAESARLISQARRLGLPYGIRVRYIPELSPGPS